MHYTPQLDDYVRWNRQYHSVQGWVYFKDSEYITIEIGVKDKSYRQIIHGTHHRKDHILIVCPVHNWKELEYIHRR